MSNELERLFDFIDSYDVWLILGGMVAFMCAYLILDEDVPARGLLLALSGAAVVVGVLSRMA